MWKITETLETTLPLEQLLEGFKVENEAGDITLTLTVTSVSKRDDIEENEDGVPQLVVKSPDAAKRFPGDPPTNLRKIWKFSVQAAGLHAGDLKITVSGEKLEVSGFFFDERPDFAETGISKEDVKAISQLIGEELANNWF
jgi:hypothetical protein